MKTMSENTTDRIVVERTFNAPIGTIWQMWTEPEHFKNWYGPEGFTVPVSQLDVRVGGKRLFCMQSPDGTMKMWLTGEYTEIVPKTRLVYTESMADDAGNIHPDFPMVSLITVRLEDLGAQTKMRMTHEGTGVNEEGASEGWEKSMDKMAARIATLVG
jgi:uncharacterized protein YndB with AHSA1/START domain